MEERYDLTDEEYNKLLDDIEKLKDGDEPVIVDGVLFGTFGNMTDEDFENPPKMPEPDWDYMLSPWYGEARKEFLKEHLDHNYYMYYRNTGKLQFHLIEINEKAYEMEERLIAEFAEKEGVDEALKKRDMLGWVGRINNIKNRVREIIREELIYVIPENDFLQDNRKQ
ncbi:MAG: TnpV protein [Clostridiales bacterium]|nr:TnpV protein [Clostridiales bacterium]